jgi:hypothetical protein
MKRVIIGLIFMGASGFLPLWGMRIGEIYNPLKDRSHPLHKKYQKFIDQMENDVRPRYNTGRLKDTPIQRFMIAMLRKAGVDENKVVFLESKRSMAFCSQYVPGWFIIIHPPLDNDYIQYRIAHEIIHAKYGDDETRNKFTEGYVGEENVGDPRLKDFDQVSGGFLANFIRKQEIRADIEAARLFPEFNVAQEMLNFYKNAQRNILGKSWFGWSSPSPDVIDKQGNTRGWLDEYPDILFMLRYSQDLVNQQKKRTVPPVFSKAFQRFKEDTTFHAIDEDRQPRSIYRWKRFKTQNKQPLFDRSEERPEE